MSVDFINQNPQSSIQKSPIQINESFRHVFDAVVSDYRKLMIVHEGDLFNLTWEGIPIELLSVDMAKTVALNSQIVDLFYRNLMPGISLIVHQDFHHPCLPHIHITMEFLAEYFKVIVERVDCSIVYMNVKKIPEAVLEKVIAFDFPDKMKLDLMNSMVDRFCGDEACHVKLARAVLLASLVGEDAFREEYRRLVKKYEHLEGDHIWDMNKELAWSYGSRLAFQKREAIRAMTKRK